MRRDVQVAVRPAPLLRRLQLLPGIVYRDHRFGDWIHV
jgi:hypothetical protein